jgi:hypothetical protein
METNASSSETQLGCSMKIVTIFLSLKCIDPLHSAYNDLVFLVCNGISHAGVRVLNDR